MAFYFSFPEHLTVQLTEMAANAAANGTKLNGTSKDHVDVLIIGAGPAGLMMATWMAKCGINARIVDKRGTKVCRKALEAN